jgi:hypothetical protein
MKPGDRVTRDGTDVHEVLSLTEDGHSGEFRCVRAPASGWCRVGAVEYNLAARYTPVGDPLAGVPPEELALRSEIAQAVKDGDALLRELCAWRLAESIMARTLPRRDD